MDSLDRRKLRENYVELVRNLNPEDVTDYLYQERVLSEEDIENIMTGATRAQRMRMFLAILPKKSKEGLIKMLEAMRLSGYIELADILEKPLSSDAINLQNGDQITPDSPTGAGQISMFDQGEWFDDARLQELKEKLEQQSEVVSSMQAEMDALQTELKRQSQNFESNEKYKRTVTVLNELEKEKAERQRVYDQIYETLLKDMNKEEREPKVSAKLSAKPSSSKTSTLSRTGHNRVPSFSMGGIRNYAKVKCVLVGDGGTGKTSIIHYFMHREKQQSYIPTVFDNRAIDIIHNNTQVTLNFWDTAGQDAYDKLRPLSYADSHVALLVFSVTSQTTLNNILAKWHPELRHYCRKVPFILVGNKTDPMEDQQKLYEIRRDGERFVEAKEANKAAEVLRAAGKKAFLCSAHSGDGIQSLLDFIVETGLKQMLRQRRKKNPCACM